MHACVLQAFVNHFLYQLEVILYDVSFFIFGFLMLQDLFSFFFTMIQNICFRFLHYDTKYLFSVFTMIQDLTNKNGNSDDHIGNDINIRMMIKSVILCLIITITEMTRIIVINNTIIKKYYLKITLVFFCLFVCLRISFGFVLIPFLSSQFPFHFL